MPTSVMRDETGSVLVEVTVVMTIMFVFLLGSIEFLFVFYQWNVASKAVEIGLRIAAVSDPVASGVSGLSLAILNSELDPGERMPYFSVTCDGGTETCTCDIRGVCPKNISYNSAAMGTIIFGRGSSSCSDATSSYNTGMCDIFSRITPANVVIAYTQTGLGFTGRPGGPSPTITISLKDLPLKSYFLGGLMRFEDIRIPAMKMSMTAEDISSRAPAF
jgi:hypothetical protein